jgi:hypothetical protein
LPLDAANIIRCIAFNLEKSLLPSSTTPSFNAFGGKNEIQGPSSVVVGLIGTVIASVFVRAIACLCFGCIVPVISLNIALAVSGRRHGRTFSNFDRVHQWLLLQRFQVQVRHFVTFFFYFLSAFGINPETSNIHIPKLPLEFTACFPGHFF